MKKCLLAIVIVFSGISTLASAGNERGNGGHVVFCGNSKDPHFVDLVLYQIKTKKYDDFKIVASSDSDHDKLIALLAPITLLNPQKTMTYMNWATALKTETVFVDDIDEQKHFTHGYSDLDLVTKLYLGRHNCRFELMILQLTPKKNEPHYFIKEHLWAKLSKDEQLIAILHEVILRGFRKDPNFYFKKKVQDLVINLIGYNQTSGSAQVHYLNNIRALLKN